jgi:undecaprenyl pyrophosphate phosphatase UppP
MLRHPAPLSASPANLAIGAVVSFIVGLAAIHALQRVLLRGRLYLFGWYCIVLGVVVALLNWPR